MEKNPSPINSPRSASNVNHSTATTPPLTPIPIHSISRSSHEANPYPTTFVQADTNSFKQVVQLLTGSSETAAKQAPSPSPSPSSTTDPSNTKAFCIPPVKTTSPKKQSFKLYERRASNFKNSLMINTLANYNCAFSSASPRNNSFKQQQQQPEILSPSLLDFPKLALSSPVTPLNDDPFNKYSSASSSASSSVAEEERAIAEKGFYLHPSPISTPRDHEPQLLPLFPLTSPRT